MADLCREFGIARKTGYKIYNRYKDCVALMALRIAVEDPEPLC